MSDCWKSAKNGVISENFVDFISDIFEFIPPPPDVEILTKNGNFP